MTTLSPHHCKKGAACARGALCVLLSRLDSSQYWGISVILSHTVLDSEVRPSPKLHFHFIVKRTQIDRPRSFRSKSTHLHLSRQAWTLNDEPSPHLIRTGLFPVMDDLIPKLLTFPPVPAPAKPLTDTQYDQTIRAISQLLTSTPTVKLASGLSTGEDIFDVSCGYVNCR